MSFLDNLEDNLKSLESREEGEEDAGRQRKARDRERATTLASAEFAEELKKGAYTAELLRQASRLGHAMRLKVHIAWLGAALRLEARGRRLEFRPTPEGVVAVHSENGAETGSEPVDLKGSPEELVKRWLAAGAPAAGELHPAPDGAI